MGLPIFSEKGETHTMNTNSINKKGQSIIVALILGALFIALPVKGYADLVEVKEKTEKR
jgi:hypothetical protein